MDIIILLIAIVTFLAFLIIVFSDTKEKDTNLFRLFVVVIIVIVVSLFGPINFSNNFFNKIKKDDFEYLNEYTGNGYKYGYEYEDEYYVDPYTGEYFYHENPKFALPINHNWDNENYYPYEENEDTYNDDFYNSDKYQKTSKNPRVSMFASKRMSDEFEDSDDDDELDEEDKRNVSFLEDMLSKMGNTTAKGLDMPTIITEPAQPAQFIQHDGSLIDVKMDSNLDAHQSSGIVPIEYLVINDGFRRTINKRSKINYSEQFLQDVIIEMEKLIPYKTNYNEKLLKTTINNVFNEFNDYEYDHLYLFENLIKTVFGTNITIYKQSTPFVLRPVNNHFVIISDNLTSLTVLDNDIKESDGLIESVFKKIKLDDSEETSEEGFYHNTKESLWNAFKPVLQRMSKIDSNLISSLTRMSTFLLPNQLGLHLLDYINHFFTSPIIIIGATNICIKLSNLQNKSTMDEPIFIAEIVHESNKYPFIYKAIVPNADLKEIFNYMMLEKMEKMSLTSLRKSFINNLNNYSNHALFLAINEKGFIDIESFEDESYDSDPSNIPQILVYRYVPKYN